MSPSSKSKAEKAVRLREVLTQTKQFVARSEQSDWTPFSPAEILADLSHAISRLERGEEVDAARLDMLFVVTGPLQETSMSKAGRMNF
jgi:hypothetical protein